MLLHKKKEKKKEKSSVSINKIMTENNYVNVYMYTSTQSHISNMG